MDYSATWLSSASLVVKNSDNTLRLFDESPVRESIKPKLINTGPAPEAGPGPRSSPPMPSNEVASKLRLKDEVCTISFVSFPFMRFFKRNIFVNMFF